MNKSEFDSIQMEAISLLLEETFLHITATAQEKYRALGKTNARLTNQCEVRFLSKGILYPPSHIVATVPYGSCIPSLHYSLLNELDTINKLMDQANYHHIKNFFIAVVSQSHNGIVLDSLLPAVLVNALKMHFPTRYFKMIDTGIYGDLKQEPLSVTQQHIQSIKEHYQSIITVIQHMLMDKLLLQA